MCEITGGNVSAVNTFGAAGLISRNVTGAGTGGGNTLYAFDERGNVA